MVRVKICGIRRIEDAQLAVESGADAVGFLVGQRHPSSDFLETDKARDIISALPPFIASVLVTHVADAQEVLRLIGELGVAVAQIHSDMGPKEIAEVRRSATWIKIIKSIHVVDDKSIETLSPYEDVVDAFLLDSINVKTGQVGGTGQTHNWQFSQSIVHRARRPVILAGGLNPENVAEAIRFVAPFGVDVNSGTKGLDGFKDAEKVRAFINQAKRECRRDNS